MSANYNYNYDTTSTDEFGHPIPSHSHSLAAGVNGPLLLQDYHLINHLAHFDRERIPERVVHAKGAGAHGYLEITADLTKYCKAAFMNRVGKRTPLFARFSTVAGERGSADSARDPRGFAVKCYTEEGNYDIVGNNTPVFFIRDTVKFPHFIHTQKRNPKSNLRDPNAAWDFWTLTPESLHQVTLLFTDRFTPYSFRHMNGYSSHTYKWINKAGEAFWIKYHFKTDQGIKNFNNEEAEHMAGADPDCHTRDLFETIENGGQASWTLCVQIMPYEDAFRYRFDPFDVTKIWPHKDYPLQVLGKMVLNRNPENYFAETEQAAFSPANLVPGVETSPDKMLQGRLFSYNDTHRHRLGANYGQIPINAPLRAKLNTYQRDGPMCVTSNGGSGPNYAPNTFGGHTEAPHLTEHADRLTGGIVRSAPNHPNTDSIQVTAFYRDVLTEKERQALVHNIVSHVKNARRDLQVRAVQYFARVDKDFGARLQKALNLSSL